jgi:hypothetical protein
LLMLSQECLDVAAQIRIGPARLIKERSAFAGAWLFQGGKENLPFGHGTNPSKGPVPTLNAESGDKVGKKSD